MSLHNFFDAASNLDPKLADSVDDVLVRLASLFGSGDVSDTRKRTALKQIHTYLQRKCAELDPILIEERDASLRKIRNDLAHGKTRRDIDLAPLYPELWRAISRLGNRLGPNEIENLLAYTLSVPNMRASARGANPTKIVQIYKPIFGALDPADKKELFAELLLRLFTDGDSLALLDQKQKK